MSIRVFVAEGHAIFREAVSLWLCRHSEFEVLTAAADGCDAVTLALRVRPDVILMDAAMPRLNGIDAMRQIAQERPSIKIIIFSESVGSQSVCAALEAGAAGCLSKYCSSEELIRAIQHVVSGGTYLCPAASTVVVQRYLGGLNFAVHPVRNPLTAKQRHIVQQIAEGQSIKEIARNLELSPKTVDWHKAQIMKKLSIDSIAGLVRYAMAEGLTCETLLPIGTGPEN